MPRSDAQRRFDAMYAIFERAASDRPDATAAIPLVNLVIDIPTLERLLNRTSVLDAPADPRQRRSETAGWDPGPAQRCAGGDDLGPGPPGGGRFGWGGDRHGTPPTPVQRQRPPSGAVAVQPLRDRRVRDTDPPLPSRPPHGMGPPRPHRRTERRPGLRSSQPAQEHRLPSPPRPTRLLAHLPTRRDRDLLTFEPLHCLDPPPAPTVACGPVPEVGRARNRWRRDRRAERSSGLLVLARGPKPAPRLGRLVEPDAVRRGTAMVRRSAGSCGEVDVAIGVQHASVRAEHVGDRGIRRRCDVDRSRATDLRGLRSR